MRKIYNILWWRCPPQHPIFFRVKHSHLTGEEQTACLKGAHYPLRRAAKDFASSTPKGKYRNHARLGIEDLEMKEYEILSDTGTCRKLVAKINRMAKEGWQAKSIGGLGAPTGISAVYVLMEREVT
jgi:hypothetical protein